MNFTDVKEMRPYLDEPKAMPSGLPARWATCIWASNSTATGGR